MAINKRQTGKKAHAEGYLAEKRAAWYLQLKGYRILEHNFKPPRGTGAGEIDLIALKDKTLIFIEVKFRPSCDAAAESVSRTVQERRIKGAEYFLMENPDYALFNMRFDVVLMSPGKLPKQMKNAFICEQT